MPRNILSSLPVIGIQCSFFYLAVFFHCIVFFFLYRPIKKESPELIIFIGSFLFLKLFYLLRLHIVPSF